MSPDADLLPSPRLRYYNPKLDPYVITMKMTEPMARAVENNTYGDGTERTDGPLNEPDEGHPYNLVSSLCEDGYHRPALDLDGYRPGQEFEAHLALIPVFGHTQVVIARSTKHLHAYLPHLAFTDWDTYRIALDQLVVQGLLEPAYVAASDNRGQTLLRPPHVRKVLPPISDPIF